MKLHCGCLLWLPSSTLLSSPLSSIEHQDLDVRTRNFRVSYWSFTRSLQPSMSPKRFVDLNMSISHWVNRRVCAEPEQMTKTITWILISDKCLKEERAPSCGSSWSGEPQLSFFNDRSGVSEENVERSKFGGNSVEIWRTQDERKWMVRPELFENLHPRSACKKFRTLTRVSLWNSKSHI